MIGRVDDRNRALLDIEVRRRRDSGGTSVTVWIDTAFDGHLVFPKSLIEELDLEPLAETKAISPLNSSSRRKHLSEGSGARPTRATRKPVARVGTRTE